jgi:hypothetical protein
MAEQANVDRECLLLGEFVDDAGGTKASTATAEVEAASALREVVRRIAVDTGVPRFKVAEVVERVVAAGGTEIEDLVRQQIRVVLREYRPDPPSKADEKPRQGIKSEEASALPA